ncbi:MAG: hypothetical protein WCI97_06480 [Bacteroidota bacterium]
MKNSGYFIFYFLVSTIITALFVIKSPLYSSYEQMLLSTTIAGAKWAIQIAAALIFLKEKSFLFLRKIGFVCFIGSCCLIPFIAFVNFGIVNATMFFVWSLLLAVTVMIVLYYRAVKQMWISLFWWLGWLGCLAVAIMLQLTVVFHSL